MCTFGVLGLSCEALAAPKPPGFHTTARVPKRVYLREAVFKTPPEFHEKTPKERKKDTRRPRQHPGRNLQTRGMFRVATNARFCFADFGLVRTPIDPSGLHSTYTSGTTNSGWMQGGITKYCWSGLMLEHASQGHASRRVGRCRHTNPGSGHVLSLLHWSELRQIRMASNTSLKRWHSLLPSTPTSHPWPGLLAVIWQGPSELGST